MKRNIKSIAWLLPILLLCFGCGKDFLEVKPEGENVILEGDAPKDKKQLFEMLNSCYDVMRSSQMYGGKAWYLTDMMTDEMDGTLFGGNWGTFYNHTIGKFNDDNRSMWSEPYYAIYRANFMSEVLGNIELTDAERKWFDGQCKLLRAVGHFEAVRKYGQPIGSSKDNDVQSGVPLRLKAENVQALRATTREVYAQVLADADVAIANLSSGYTPSEFYYLNANAAKAFKAKVLFYMNRTSEALPLLNDVIAAQGNQLDSLNRRFVARNTLSNAFPKEVIFGLYSSFTSDAELFSNYNDRDAGPKVDVTFKVSQEAAYLFDNEPNDKRKAAWLQSDGVAIANHKFEEVRKAQLTGDRGFIIPVIHVTELKLMRAECMALGDDLSGARADLNDIRQRAGLISFTSNDKQALVDEIRLQRRIEMIGEGNRLYEIKRIGTFFQNNLTFRQNSLGLTTIPWDCNGMLVQLPDRELNGNTALLDNPTGGCN